MTYTIVRLSVNDFDAFKAVFEEAAALRQGYGSQGVTLFRNVDKANEVVVLGRYADLDRVRQLFKSPEFRAATQRAGVSGPPEITFLDEVEQLDA